MPAVVASGIITGAGHLVDSPVASSRMNWAIPYDTIGIDSLAPVLEPMVHPRDRSFGNVPSVAGCCVSCLATVEGCVTVIRSSRSGD